MVLTLRELRSHRRERPSFNEQQGRMRDKMPTGHQVLIHPQVDIWERCPDVNPSWTSGNAGELEKWRQVLAARSKRGSERGRHSR